jgi:putative ABC transport system permease protein
VEATVRYCGCQTTVAQLGDEYVPVNAVAVEKDFFTMFPHLGRFIEGGPECLDAPSNVIVCETFARQHDLKSGQTIRMDGEDYLIAGIIKDFENTIFKNSDLIVNVRHPANQFAIDKPYDGYGMTITFVKIVKGTDPQVFYDKAEKVCKEIYPIYGHVGFFERLEMTRFDQLFFNANGYEFNHGDLKTLKMLALVGLLLLLSAVFNYINLSFALTGKRAKEMATRRLLGAQKGEIVWKYVAESLVFTTVCFGLGLLLAYLLAPSVNALLNDPDVPIRVRLSFTYILAYLAGIFVVGVLNGIIPALFASRVQPIDVVKGTFRRNTKMVFNKVFIVAQSVFAVFLIAMAIVMEAQYRTSLHRPMHCNIQDKYYVLVSGQQPQPELFEKLGKLSCVKRIGRSVGVPGFVWNMQYSWEGEKNFTYWNLQMDTTSFQMLGFEVLKDYKAPLYSSMWFGERTFAALGFSDDDHVINTPLISGKNESRQAAGVIRDFPTNCSNMGEETNVVISILREDEVPLPGYLLEIVGDHSEAAKAITKVVGDWCHEQQTFYFANGFIDDFYCNALKPAKNNMRLLEIFMLLAVLISLLGLLAMSTYYAGENAKGIAVHKVFGATVKSETWRTVREYMLLVAVACVVGVPIAVWAAQRYLEGFIVRLEHYGWIFFVAVLISLAMAFLSVLWQTLRAARTNPAVALKKE